MLEDIEKAIILLEGMEKSIYYSFFDDYCEVIELLYKVYNNIKLSCKDEGDN